MPAEESHGVSDGAQGRDETADGEGRDDAGDVMDGAPGPADTDEVEPGPGGGSGSADDGVGDSEGGPEPPPRSEPDYLDCGDLIEDDEVFAGGPDSPLGYPERPCDPRASGEGAYACCSVDPAAENGLLPAYEGVVTGLGGWPYFSGLSNDLGGWGICTLRGDPNLGATLFEAGVEGCPRPCNPTWPRDAVEAICGEHRVCCQTHELGPADCIFDEALDRWRPAAGDDIGNLTEWSPGAHATQQDPGALACLELAGGDQDSAIYATCLRELTLADQRGICSAPATTCHIDSDYIDPCAALNE